MVMVPSDNVVIYNKCICRVKARRGPEGRAERYTPREKANNYRWPVIKFIMRDIKRRSAIQIQCVMYKGTDE